MRLQFILIFGILHSSIQVNTQTVERILQEVEQNNYYTLVLNISQDYYEGNAQYQILIDDQQIGDDIMNATAPHYLGQSNTLTIKQITNCKPKLIISFLNDAWAGSIETDRNLFVDSIVFNGVNQNIFIYMCNGQVQLELDCNQPTQIPFTGTNCTFVPYPSNYQPSNAFKSYQLTTTNKYIPVSYSQNSYVFKQQVTQQTPFTAYGFGMWTKFLRIGPKRIQTKAPYYLIGKLDSEIYTGTPDPGQCLLSVYLGIDSYEFRTFSSQQNIKFNINYGLQLDGVWNYIYFGSQSNSEVSAWIQFSNGTIVNQKINVIQQPVNYLSFSIQRDKQYIDASNLFNGYMTQIMFAIGEGSFINNQQNFQNLISYMPMPYGRPIQYPIQLNSTLVLYLSEDQYKGNAQFKLYIDNQQIQGKYTVTAHHSSRQYNTLILNGNFTCKSSVTIQFLNDLYDGNYNTDRNLYLDNMMFNGIEQNISQTMLSSGSYDFQLQCPITNINGFHIFYTNQLQQLYNNPTAYFPNQFAGSKEYSVSGWVRWVSDGSDAAPFNILFRLSDNQPQYIQDLSNPGDRTLAAWISIPSGVYYFSTYNCIENENYCNNDQALSLSYDDLLTQWTYIYYGYSSIIQQTYINIQLQGKQLTYTQSNVNHFSPTAFTFYLGQDRYYPGYIGYLADFNLNFGYGAYNEGLYKPNNNIEQTYTINDK